MLIKITRLYLITLNELYLDFHCFYIYFYMCFLVILESEIPDRNRCSSNGSINKRKRSWSRAVFSNLQRKGLEKRFQIQKYITKPDRRQLAATLGLTDAQVKFVNSQVYLFF